MDNKIPTPDIGGKNPKEYKDISMAQQVHALCLAAKKEVSVDLIKDWIQYGKGSELSPQEIDEINRVYADIEASINWGADENNQAIVTQLGITYQSVHKIIANELCDSLDL